MSAAARVAASGPGGGTFQPWGRRGRTARNRPPGPPPGRAGRRGRDGSRSSSPRFFDLSTGSGRAPRWLSLYRRSRRSGRERLRTRSGGADGPALGRSPARALRRPGRCDAPATSTSRTGSRTEHLARAGFVVLAVVSYLRTRPEVDPERIGLWGHP